MALASNAACIVGLDAMLALANVGVDPVFEVFTGVGPTSTLTAATGLKLGTLVMAADVFVDASAGAGQAQAASNLIGSDISADNDGVPGYFRINDGNGLVVFQGTAGGPSSGEECEFSKASFVLGDTVTIISLLAVMFELTAPA